MERSVERHERLVRSATLATLGELVADAAHEFNNSLTAILGFSQLLRGAGRGPEASRNVELLTHEVQRATGIVSSLLSFARTRDTDYGPVDLADIVKTTVELRKHNLVINGILVDTNFAEHLPFVFGNRGQLQSVLLNLLNNAQQAMTEAHDKGRLQITTSWATDSDRAIVTFADNGPGIRPEHLDLVFDPFFTTKDIDKGTGLGLSICREIIGRHGGRIWAESDYGRGATLFVELPIAQQRSDRESGERSRPGHAERSPLVAAGNPCGELPQS